MVETWCGGLGCCSPEVERVSHGQPARFFYMNIRLLEKGSPSQLRQGSLCRISPTLGSVLLLNICTFGHFFHLKQSAPAKGLFKSRGTEEARHS